MDKKTKWGGKRPGAGRPPRKDGRTLVSVKVALTPAELEQIKTLTPDQRRAALIAAIAPQ